jgi:hypothetical protein
VVTGRAALPAAVAVSVAAPLLRTSWAPVSHAQNSWRTRSGSSERRAGPVDGPLAEGPKRYSDTAVTC